MNMDDIPSVDAHQREPSFTPSPTPSSSPANSSGYEPSESSDTSPVPNRAAGRRASTPHTPGPGLPREGDTESSSSSDELNISSDSNAIPMDFDKNHQDSLLSNETKPLVENMEISSASEMVTNTTQSLQELDTHQDYVKGLETENRNLKDEIMKLKEKMKQHKMQQRQPLAPLNGRDNISCKKPAHDQLHIQDQQHQENCN